MTEEMLEKLREEVADRVFDTAEILELLDEIAKLRDFAARTRSAIIAWDTLPSCDTCMGDNASAAREAARDTFTDLFYEAYNIKYGL